MGFELFQVSKHQSRGALALDLGIVGAAGAAMLYRAGSHCIDWWELVAGSEISFDCFVLHTAEVRPPIVQII